MSNITQKLNAGDKVILDKEFSNSSIVEVVQQSPGRLITIVTDGQNQWQVMTCRLTMHEVAERYNMCKDQTAQIDCRMENCKYQTQGGYCNNVSPAITLNPNGKFCCWSFKDKE